MAQLHERSAPRPRGHAMGGGPATAAALAAFLNVALAKTPAVEIAPGVFMPRVNLGTWQLGNGKPSDPRVGVPQWIQAGGDGLDCAYDYFNQDKVAEAIKESGVPREQLFITTKVPGVGNALDMVMTDLKQLGTAYADLVLLHAPVDIEGQWKGLEQALAMNLTRAIGISNFDSKQIEQLMRTATVRPAVNQCQMSVAHHDDATIAYCQQHNITYEAWGAMKGCPFTDPTVAKIAKAHNVSAAQVCLRWGLDRGCVLAVGTGSNSSTVPIYTKEDLSIFAFSLTQEEVSAINALHPPTA